ncbi:MAG: hypothetical protein ACC658_01540 [Acidimicrobiia bacterium]
MRLRRLSFIAGWAAVALLAVAGFAAFASPSPSSQQVQVEAASESMGHTSGAYAGLAFALLGGDQSATSTELDVPEGYLDPSLRTLKAFVQESQTEDDSSEETHSSAGTVVSPTSGWLSEVEVRALLSLYFAPEDVNRAVRVAWCESRFDPDSVNLRTGGVGLFQHLPKYWDERAANAGFSGFEPTNAEASSAAAAWAVYQGGGWDVFGCQG